MSKSKVIAVVGPTGSGKTDLAVKIAKDFNGVIISADSRQVYRGLDIGTNKEGELGEWRGFTSRTVETIPQLLIDIVDPGTRFTLNDWLIEARRAIRTVTEQNMLPILTGGTGLYVSALLENWQPKGDDVAKRGELEQLMLPELQKLAAGLNLNESDFKNKRRLIRALERSVVSEQKPNDSLEVDGLVIEVDRPRERLYEKSDRRYFRIFDDLMIEYKSLIDKGVDPEWLQEIGLDYRYAYRHFSGELTKEEAIRLFNFRSHAYIRRQLTWWRHHGEVKRVGDVEKAEELVKKFLSA